MIDAAMWRGALEVGVVMALVTLLAIDLYLPGVLIAGSHSLDNARTAGFTVLVLAQLFNALSALGLGQRMARPVRQPLAVGRADRLAAAAGGGGQPAAPQRRVRHGAAEPGPMARLRGAGKQRAVGQRTEQAAGRTAAAGIAVRPRLHSRTRGRCSAGTPRPPRAGADSATGLGGTTPRALLRYSAYVPDLPGCVATGGTVAEVEAEIREAIAFHLEGLREDGVPVPEPTSKVEYIGFAA